ncbi:MAG: polyphosphate kinase 2 family protein [Chloroflexi bacterium]|nr:polyphosphate kinase 2 family protein [Chloroflexota bacterium]
MDHYRVKPASKVDLSKWDPKDKSAFDGDKELSKVRLKYLNHKLRALQEVLYAEGKHKVLVVFQAMDAGGKDGTIRSVFKGVNPQGIHVASFKAPAPEELAHDFLWRIHKRTPGRGEIAVFNRSHYEDVLVARVHKLVAEKVWSKRYDHINCFEAMLADEGTTILKFYLQIDKDEQKKRLQERLENPTKHWKFNRADLSERKLWDDYMAAYEDVLSKTSTEQAPWYIIPADHNWYRNLMVSEVLVKTLEDLQMAYPEPEAGLDKIEIE